MKVYLFACLFNGGKKYGADLIFAESLNEAMGQFRSKRKDVVNFDVTEATQALEIQGFTYKDKFE